LEQWILNAIFLVQYDESQITPDENDGTFSCLEQNNAMAAACKKVS
jgi:hypothetical protein